MQPNLRIRQRGGGSVEQLSAGTRLSIPAGDAGAYRWAQIDDYMGHPRAAFHWQPPVTFAVRARASAAVLPGTWGFGLWNDPFTANLGFGGMPRRLPALPNAAWFFYAGAPNHLAFHDDHPAQGFLAATFSSVRLPSLLFSPGVLALPLLAIRPAARLLRRAARLLIRESAAQVTGDPTEWHNYALAWTTDRVTFSVDGAEIYTTPVSPRPPLGIVIWIDNQYAAFPPSGKLQMGTSPNPAPAWIECAEISINGAPCRITD